VKLSVMFIQECNLFGLNMFEIYSTYTCVLRRISLMHIIYIENLYFEPLIACLTLDTRIGQIGIVLKHLYRLSGRGDSSY